MRHIIPLKRIVVIVMLMLGVQSAPAQKLFWTDDSNNKIQRADLDGYNVEDIIIGLTGPFKIAVDQDNNKIYWTDINTGKVQRADLVGSNIEDLVTIAFSFPQGIDLDTLNGKIYWVDNLLSKIQRANLDGSNVEDVIAVGLQGLRAITVDSAGGKLYWTDGTGDTIFRANLNGTNIEDLALTNLSFPTGIAFDASAGKVYWCDSANSTIRRVDANGSNQEDLITAGISGPFDIALDSPNNKIYWIEGSKVRRANLEIPAGQTAATRGDLEDLITGLGGNVFGLAIQLSVQSVHNLTKATDHFTLQEAIDAADNGNVIEADPGTYFEAINFNGKAITLRSASGDPNDTIIDGTGNFHVVQCVNGEDLNTVLDGFTITGGNANGSDPDDKGAGMFNSGSSPTINHCIFSGNTATGDGGGMYTNSNLFFKQTVNHCIFSGNTANFGGGMFNKSNGLTVNHCVFSGNLADSGGGMFNDPDSSPTVFNCTFSGNTAINDGGGMRNDDAGSPTITNCTFKNNTGGWGGGMNNNISTPTVTNCIFIGNSAGFGGGMYNIDLSFLFIPMVTNCVFSGNTATIDGGGMRNFNHSGVMITNCTFSGNTADLDGGGMANGNDILGSPRRPTVSNSIFWGNSDSGGMDESAQIHTDLGDEITKLHYSNIMGGQTGGGLINADPLFVDPNGMDGMIGTEDDNLRLQIGSPCMDSADASSLPGGIVADLDGNLRVVDIPAVTNTGFGMLTFVDMGAYEFQDPCNGAIEGDINCDGIVNLLDLVLLAQNFLETI